jgi:peptidoglycan/LPS O-acetylase OafA/YrhL
MVKAPSLHEYSKAQKNYMPTLDGLRAFACLLVVVAHIVEFSKLDLFDTAMVGTVGVIIFFALSGFLMGALYFNRPFGERNAVSYSIARLTRIVPAYYLAVTIYIISQFIVPGSFEITTANVARLYLFLSSASVFWSIPPEMQFYVFFAFLWLAFHRLKEGNIFLMGVILLGSLALVATRDMWPGILLPSKLHIFILGLVACFALTKDSVKNYLCHPVFQAGIIAGLVIYITYALESSEIFNDIFFAAIIALLVPSLSKTTVVTSIFASRIFRFIGAASFSIYLLHGTVIRMTDAFVAPVVNAPPLMMIFTGVACVVVPSIFYIIVEKPINRWAKEGLTKLYAQNRGPFVLFPPFRTFLIKKFRKTAL